MSDHVCTHHLPRLYGASHIDAFCMVRPLSLALQLWLFHTLDTPPSVVCLPCFIRMHFSHGQGSIPLGSLACCTVYYTDEASRLLTDTTNCNDIIKKIKVATAKVLKYARAFKQQGKMHYRQQVTLTIWKAIVHVHSTTTDTEGTRCPR